MKPTLWNTSNDLPEGVRITSINLLNQQVSDIIDLCLQTKQAHWNLKGPNFIGIHLFLDEVRDELDELTDTMAERAVQIGGVALGTIQTVSKASRLSAYPLDIFAAEDHLKAMSKSLAAVGKSTRKAADDADEAGDADTSDVFTQVSRGIDILLWKIEAHLVS